mgnify:CR=1 FL=1
MKAECRAKASFFAGALPRRLLYYANIVKTDGYANLFRRSGFYIFQKYNGKTGFRIIRHRDSCRKLRDGLLPDLFYGFKNVRIDFLDLGGETGYDIDFHTGIT